MLDLYTLSKCVDDILQITQANVNAGMLTGEANVTALAVNGEHLLQVTEVTVVLPHKEKLELRECWTLARCTKTICFYSVLTSNPSPFSERVRGLNECMKPCLPR